MASTFTRRRLVGSAIALGPSIALAEVSPPPRMEDLIRVIGRADNGISIRWTDGVLSGMVDGEVTPLLRPMSQIFARHRLRPDGGCDVVMIEAVCFADLITRRALDTWRNPYTGETVQVPTTTLGPTSFTIQPILEITRTTLLAPGTRLTHRIEIERDDGEEIWLTERLDSTSSAPTAGAQPFSFHETFTFQAKRPDLDDQSRVHVPAAVQKFNVLSWRPWMEMGNRPGRTITRAHGRVVADMAGLPADFAAINRVRHRDIVDDLDAYLTF